MREGRTENGGDDEVRTTSNSSRRGGCPALSYSAQVQGFGLSSESEFGGMAAHCTK